ncbi:hypothetical protein pb186bvf_000861 [Paramecium bursaria]
MNPNEEQQRFIQMIQQMNGSQDFQRMIPVPQPYYQPYWPPYHNPMQMMQPKPFEPPKFFQEEFMQQNPQITPFDFQMKPPFQQQPLPVPLPIQNMQNMQNLQNLQNMNNMQNMQSVPFMVQQNQVQQQQAQQQQMEQAFSQIVNEFQLKILNMFVVQNQMLLEFKNKNQNLENTITQILDEITNLQKIVETKMEANDDLTSRLSLPQQELTQNNILLKSLFETTDFQYSLIMVNDLEMPLFKDKNFNLELQLKDNKGQMIRNPNKIELEVSLYSSDDKPVQLINNTSNQPILRQPDNHIWLHDGQVNIEKLQINEVTSHFQNGWIYLIVYPIKEENKQLQINPAQIKPLVIQLIVKSKKTKKNSRSRSRSFEKLKRLEKLEEQSSSSNDPYKDEEIYQNDQSES